MNLYTIVFEDNKVFLGGTIENPKWLEIPFKKIRSIFYKLPLGDNLILSGYERYYHFVEAITDLSGDKKGKKQLIKAYLIGNSNREYKVYEIDLVKGQIEIKNLDEKDIFITNLNPIGWR